MSLVRFALLALLGAHGSVAGVVRPKQPVVRRIHTEASHASFPTGKMSSEGTREVVKNTATKQAPSPRAPTSSKRGKLATHEGVVGLKHSKKIVAHQDDAKSPIGRVPAGKTRAPTSFKKGKLATHEGVAGVKHSKQFVAHQDDAESPIGKVSVGKTSLKQPLNDDAHKLGEAYAGAVGKTTATKQAPNPRAPTSFKKGELATPEGVGGVKHSKQPVEAPIVKFLAGKTSSNDPVDDDADRLGEAYARAFGKMPSPKTSSTPEVSSTQLQANGGTSAEKQQGLSAKSSPVQIQDRLSDNAEHMIEAALA